MIYNTQPTERQCRIGALYLLFQLLVLPSILRFPLSLMENPPSAGQVNFVYYLLNFTAVILIFRSYLLQSLKDASKHIFLTLWLALLGYMGDMALTAIVSKGIYALYPDFSNVNDDLVVEMLRADFPLMAVGTVLLVPIAEETFFRGMIFRKFYDRSPVAAYLVSMGLFALVHVTGYIGTAEPIVLFFCFLQYLPAGYALAFVYRHSGSICAPILTHMLVNAAGILSVR